MVPGGNFEHGATVLAVQNEMAAEDRERFERAHAVLFEARKNRIAPGRDDTLLAGCNGLALRGLAFAARVFERHDWAQLATRAADFIASRSPSTADLLVPT